MGFYRGTKYWVTPKDSGIEWFYFHTLNKATFSGDSLGLSRIWVEHSAILWVCAEMSSESRKNDKSRFPLSTYFKAHTGSGGMDQQQLVRSQTPSDEVAGGLENLWQKFSNIPWITWENASSQVFESSHVGWISFKMMDPLPYVWEISKSSRLQKSASPQMILALLFPQTQGCQKRKGRRGENERNSNLGWAPLKSLSKGTLVSYFCSWDNHLP